MKQNIVNFSGGRSSAYLVWLFEQRKKNEDIDVEYIFCDTGAEHPKTYKFIKDVVDHWGIDLTCLRTKVSPTKGVGSTYRVVALSECKQDLVPYFEYIKVYGTPAPGASRCTNEMKSVPCDKYCNEKYGRNNYTKWLGIRADEPHRIRTVDKQLDLFCGGEKIKTEYLPLRYLGEIDDSDKQDILDFWSEQPFDLEITEELGNCVFCIKKSINKIALAAKKEPKMAVAFAGMLNHPAVRHHPAKIKAGLASDQVFRNRMTLPQIIANYENVELADLEEMVNRGRQFDAGACSEACEAISINADLFEDE